MKIKFCQQFSKNPQTFNFMKTHHMGAESFHLDGHT